MAEAKHAVVMAIRGQRASVLPDRAACLDRLWKLFSNVDALLLHRCPRSRGGKRGQGAHSLNHTLAQRLRSFWAGAWGELWLDLEISVRGAAKRAQAKSQEAEDKRTVTAMQELMRHNAVSKALSRISDPMRFAAGTDVPQRLQDMFPQPPAVVPPQTPHAEISAELRQELVAHIDHQLQSLPSMAGAGANGSYYEHLMLHKRVHDGTACLADVLADLLTGEAPAVAVQALRSGRAHPPLKPGSDTDIRPLVASSSQWRVAMRGWSKMFEADVLEAVGSSQFGVARPGGAVAMRHELEIRMAADPTLSLASLDISNMHGSMELSNIEHSVQNRVPRMWPLLSRWFRTPRHHVYLDRQGGRHPILAKTGLDQGCPGSSSLACLGIADFHDTISEHCFVVGCQDDTYLLMDQAKIKESLEAVAPALIPSGTTLSLRKSAVWSPGTCDVGTSGIRRTPSVPLVLKQSLLLPRPDNHAMPQAFDAAGFDKLERSRVDFFNRLQDLKASGLSTQHAICLARAVVGGDSVYLQQCHVLGNDRAASLDKICLDGILALLEIDSSENDALGIGAARWFLPWKRGGFGFAAAQHSSHANFLGSWFRDLDGLAERMDMASPQSLLDRAPCIRAVLQDALGHISMLGGSIATGLDAALAQCKEDQKLARRLRSEVVTRIGNNIESGAPNEQVIGMRESGGSGGGAWLQFPKLPSHHFSNQEFRTSVRLRMCMDVHSKGPTQTLRCKHKSSIQRGSRICDAPLDCKGHHSLLCNLGGYVVRRHNGGRDCLADLIDTRVQSTVHIEQHTPEMAADQRHPDIDFHDHQQRHVYVDYEVCTPHAGPAGNAIPHRAGSLIETAEGVKRRKYRHLILVPAVCSHLGRFGTGVQTLFRMICRDADETQRSRSIDECYQTLGCDIQKANVALLGAAWTLL